MAMSREERDALVEQYAQGPDRVRDALAKVPKEALQWRPGPGKWSAHEVVVHCADAETNAALRIRYLIAEKDPLIVGYDQDAWARIFDYHTQPLEESLGGDGRRAGPYGAAPAPDERSGVEEGGPPHGVGPLHGRGLAADLRGPPRGPRAADRAEP